MAANLSHCVALADATNHLNEESDLQQQQQLVIKRHSKACADVYHYTRTTKNGLCLVVCGYRFTKSRRNGRSETYWRCAIRRCSATAKTSANGLLLSVLHVHSHSAGKVKQQQPTPQLSPNENVNEDKNVGSHSVKSLLSISGTNRHPEMTTELDENVANISFPTCAKVWRKDEESDGSSLLSQQYSPQIANRHWLSAQDMWQLKSEVQSEADYQTRPEVPECNARQNGQIPAFIPSFAPFTHLRASTAIPMVFKNRSPAPPNVVPPSIIASATRLHSPSVVAYPSAGQIQPVNLTTPCQRTRHFAAEVLSAPTTFESIIQSQPKKVCSVESIDSEKEWLRVRAKTLSILTTSLNKAVEQLQNADSLDMSLRCAQLVHQVTKSVHILRSAPCCANCSKEHCISSDVGDASKSI